MDEKQKFFNKVARGLLRQMKKSKGKDGCLYRGPNGLRCGIGHAFPDSVYNKDMEGSSAAMIK